MPTLFRGSWKRALSAKTDASSSTGIVYIKNSSNLLHMKYTGYNLENNERVQPVETLNDNIHIYTFGKRISTISLEGFIIGTKNTDIKLKPILDEYDKEWRAFSAALKGKPVALAGPFDLYFEGVISNFVYSCSAEHSNVVMFRMTLLITP